MVFVHDNRLWRTRLDPAQGVIGEPKQLDEPALYASRADDGSIAYVSGDGLRVRRPDGRMRRLGWPITFRPAPFPGPLVIRNARVIPGTGAAPTGLSDVYIARGRITRIVPANHATAPATDVLDVGGRSVIPGLIDLHGHLWDDATLPAALAAGTTTLRDMGSAAARTAAFRDAVTAGAMEGPRLVLGGFQFNPGLGGGISSPTSQGPSDVGGIERGLAIANALGTEYAKMRIPGSLGLAVHFVEAAQRRGWRVSGHCTLSLPIVAAGIDGKEHLGPNCEERYEERIYDDVTQLLRRSGQWVVPTAAGFAAVPLIAADTAALAVGAGSSFVTPFLRWWMLRQGPAAATYDRFANDVRQGVTTLHRAGVVIGAGSDVAASWLGLPLELEQLVASGLTPLEALTAATATAATILGTDEIGTIRPGSVADLVVLDADPLQDIRNVRRVRHVIQGGRIIRPGPLADRRR